MKTRLRRAAPMAAIGAIVVVLAASIWLLAVPAASSGTARGCTSVATGTTGGLDGPDDILPSSGLDGLGRECGGNPAGDQSFDEAIVAGAGLILFGGAMLVYRQRRTHHPRRVARA